MAFYSGGVKEASARPLQKKLKKTVDIYFMLRIFRFVNNSEKEISGEMPLERFSERVMQLMSRLAFYMVAHESNYLSRGFITVPQLLALCRLAELKGCTMHELARAIGMKASTATGLVDRMEKHGLVRRLGSSTDRRVVLVSITSKGRRVMAQLDAEKRKFTMKMFAQISGNERMAYLGIMEKIAAMLSAEDNAGKN